MADATETIIGMVPMMAALGVLKKTTDMVGGTQAPPRRKISLSEKKITLRRR